MGAVITSRPDEDLLLADQTRNDQQEERILLVTPYALLSVATALYLIVPYGDPAAKPYILGVAAIAAIWEYLWWTRPRSIPEHQQARIVAYLAGGVLLSGVLVLFGPWFAFFAWTHYLRAPYVGNPVIRWIAFICVAAQLASSQVGGIVNLNGNVWWGFAALFVINLGIAAGMMVMEFAREERHDERRLALVRVSETNRRLEETLAENARLQQDLTRQARDSGIAEERARLAREIHDTIAQGLAGVLAQLEAARAPGVLDQARHLQIAHQLARESLGEARRSVDALHPQALTGSRFAEALARMAKQWGEVHDIPVDIETSGEPRALPPDSEVALFRVAQEALANTAKHAQPTSVAITLAYLPDAVALDVRDDGAGFDVSAPPASESGYGIGVMRDRIDRLGGYFEIESSAEEGTTLSAVVPGVRA